MKSLFKVTALCLAVSGAYADPMENCEEVCNYSVQSMGDSTSSADNSQSQASNSNNSTASVNSAAGNDFNVSPKIQQSGNVVDQSGTTQVATGGNSASTSHGNTSTNDNKSSANNSATNLGGSAVNGGMALDNTVENRTGDFSSVIDASGRFESGDIGSTSSIGDVSPTASINGITVAPEASSSSENNLGIGISADVDAGTTVNSETVVNTGNTTVDSDTFFAAGDTTVNTGASSVNVDAANRSSTKIDARALYIPQVTAPVIPSTNPASNISVKVGDCGPLFTLDRQKVKGKYIGFFFNSDVDLGHEDFKQPYVDDKGYRIMYNAVEMPDGSWNILGSRAIYFVATLNVSGSRQLGFGGGSGFDHGQASGGASSAMQMMVTNIQEESCMLGRVEPLPPPVSYLKNKE